tara:strand:- start:5418 stop:6548 length:1131 start_codon:yes stop_codon:yes gene_type:complete
MKRKLKVLTIVGTRPELIRLSMVIKKLEKNFNHVLVHTGQNYDYELNEIFFNEFQIKKPKYYLDSARENASKTIGQILIDVDDVLEKENPDAILILGDTNSCISALAAKRRKIPIFHMEAGNRCFDMRVPEEINRKIVDHISDINMTYSTIARDYLIMEGIRPEKIIKTGSPMKEVLDFHNDNIENSDILNKLKLVEDKFFLVSCHREENIDDNDNFSNLCESINAIAEKYCMPIVFSTHPRTRKVINKNKIKFNKLVMLSKPLGFFDYNKLQRSSKCVLSDSGTITEESSISNFRALNIRYSNERPEGFEEGAVMMVGLKKNRIMQALNILSTQSKGSQSCLKIVSDYEVDNVSEKVIRAITSYVDYVNFNTWKK